MSNYTVLPHHQQSGYMVNVITDMGSHHTILGFETEAEAQDWVEADRRLEQTPQPLWRPA